MAKKISIIIPAYNAQKYIVRCLDSIVNQANDNIEVVIVNDGSTDNTERICREYSSIYNYIKTVSQTNGGVSSARNNGIKNAQGEYILFLDADDFLAPGAIGWVIDNVKHNDTLICGSFNYIKTRGRVEPYYLPEKIYDLKKDTVDSIMDFIPNAPWGKIYNRNIITENDIVFPLGIPYAEDTIFMLEYLKYVKFVQTSSAIIYNYNFTDSGSAMWKYYPEFYKYMIAVMKKKEELCDFKGIDYNAESDKQKFFTRCLNHYMRNSAFDKLDSVIKVFEVNKSVKAIKKEWYMHNWKNYIMYNLKKKVLM